jgi:hypothetical protein
MRVAPASVFAASVAPLSAIFSAALGMKNRKDYDILVAPAMLQNGGSIEAIAAAVASDLSAGICDWSSLGPRRQAFGVNRLPEKPIVR